MTGYEIKGGDIVEFTKALRFCLVKVTKIEGDTVFAQLVPNGFAFAYPREDLKPYVSENPESAWRFTHRYSGDAWWLWDGWDKEREEATGRHDWWMLDPVEVAEKRKALAVQKEAQQAAAPSVPRPPFQHTCLECGHAFNGKTCSACGESEYILFTGREAL